MAPFWRRSELDRITVAELRDRIAEHEPGAHAPEPRTYPGYPRWTLPRVRARPWVGMERTLARRRSERTLAAELPGRSALGRLLRFSHGITASGARGPAPSAGGLQALELYVVTLAPGWLPAGAYHYDRPGHHLSQVVAGETRDEWSERVPALRLVTGGALLWLLVGDVARVEAKYGERGYRFLVLEAGHAMQNLCLMSAALGLATVPLGGFLEGAVARALALPRTDAVLYAGACGRPEATEGRSQSL